MIHSASKSPLEVDTLEKVGFLQIDNHMTKLLTIFGRVSAVVPGISIASEVDMNLRLRIVGKAVQIALSLLDI